MEVVTLVLDVEVSSAVVAEVLIGLVDDVAEAVLRVEVVPGSAVPSVVEVVRLVLASVVVVAADAVAKVVVATVVDDVVNVVVVDDVAVVDNVVAIVTTSWIGPKSTIVEKVVRYTCSLECAVSYKAVPSSPHMP